MVNSIPGVPPPIPHSKLVGPEKVRLAGSGSDLASEPVNQPLVKLALLSEVAALNPAERSEYFQSVGRQATARATAKVVDILA
jgi:hypothetical protein